jgi:hypothetical protein
MFAQINNFEYIVFAILLALGFINFQDHECMSLRMHV